MEARCLRLTAGRNGYSVYPPHPFLSLSPSLLVVLVQPPPNTSLSSSLSVCVVPPLVPCSLCHHNKPRHAPVYLVQPLSLSITSSLCLSFFFKFNLSSPNCATCSLRLCHLFCFLLNLLIPVTFFPSCSLHFYFALFILTPQEKTKKVLPLYIQTHLSFNANSIT